MYSNYSNINTLSNSSMRPTNLSQSAYPQMSSTGNMAYGNSNDERFIAGGFLGPFILGGITGGLLAPAFTGPRPGYSNNYYYPYPVYPPYYYGPYYR